MSQDETAQRLEIASQQAFSEPGDILEGRPQEHSDVHAEYLHAAAGHVQHEGLHRERLFAGTMAIFHACRSYSRSYAAADVDDLDGSTCFDC